MKKSWAILVLIAVIAALFFLSRSKNPPISSSTAENGVVPGTVFNAPTAQSRTQSVPPAAANASGPMGRAQTDLASRAASPNPSSSSATDTNEPLALPPSLVLDKARVLIHNYHAAFGENPVGTNPEIAAALQGKNSRQINFLAESGLRLNDKGEIVDGYGTAFFFHQISGQEMEIRSAGPDKVMWTSDDLVTK